jgi:NAD(P)-dependent dehydrogenase (short-subunit alcohol dehydrogenase family)
VEVLVNNASLFPADRVIDFELVRFDSHIQINSLAPLVLARDLAAGGRRGAVVNLLDTRIIGHDSAHASYLLSKRLLYELTRMLAIELAPRVRVNAVAPGLILPPRGKDEGYLRQKVHQNPLRRTGDLQGVTDAVLFLVRSEFITGQVIFVDGGQHLYAPLLG